MNSWIAEYIMQQKAALDSIPVEQVSSLIARFAKAHREDRQIFICGNGGSASNASHFITDLGKGASDKLPKRFRCMALNDNISWITALGNDYSYEEVYSRQLMNFGKPGDILLALSVSGSSPNLVKAFEWANQNGIETVAIVGGKRGRLSEIARETIVINSQHYGRVEDVQMGICHLLCYAFIERPDEALRS
ncbi:MAG: SIS domain-containing protein [Verrucomicrobiota bacterium]|nr:SIS domain-containing protein [Verrucomicrobiota bacterium]